MWEKKNLENSSSEKDNLVADIYRITAERDALKSETTKLADHNKILATELKKAMTTHSSGNQQLEALTKQYQELQDRSAREIEELQNTNNNLLQQISELQQKSSQNSNQVSQKQLNPLFF